MKQSGFQVQQATNGYEAFQMVANSLQDPQDFFTLILMDLNMPISDGFDTC